jgi:dihydrodipicolinate reductase
MALRILINGGKGRMGLAVAAAAKEMGVEIAG